MHRASRRLARTRNWLADSLRTPGGDRERSIPPTYLTHTHRRCRTGHAPLNLALIRNFALRVVRCLVVDRLAAELCPDLRQPTVLSERLLRPEFITASPEQR